MAYRPGDWYGQCQRCGTQQYGSNLMLDGNTDNLIVCKKCYNRKHPNDAVEPIQLGPEPIPPLISPKNEGYRS